MSLSPFFHSSILFSLLSIPFHFFIKFFILLRISLSTSLILSIFLRIFFPNRVRKLLEKKENCNLNTQLGISPTICQRESYWPRLVTRPRWNYKCTRGGNRSCGSARPLVRRDKSSTIPMNISPRHFDTASHCLLV